MPSDRLAVEFAGINFKNPFMLSSAPPTMDARHMLRAARLGWGGAVFKTVTEEPTVDPRTRLGVLRRGDLPIGMNNIEPILRNESIEVIREKLQRWLDSSELCVLPALIDAKSLPLSNIPWHPEQIAAFHRTSNG